MSNEAVRMICQTVLCIVMVFAIIHTDSHWWLFLLVLIIGLESDGK